MVNFMKRLRDSINRNILECKDFDRTLAVTSKLVLIETYWNVKFTSQHSAFNQLIVLIETYWNVKTVINTAHVAHIRVLIETYWNVKKVGALVIFKQSQY